MRVLRREWFGVSRSDTFRVIPIGDIHIGNAACDENLLRSVVKRIANEPNTYWIGMGDMCDFINVRDPRFSPSSLAGWVKVADLTDLAQAQKDRFLGIVEPIAPQCLALLEGNHETAITKHFERHIFGEIVTGIKQMGNFPADYQLALGYYGWLQLAFYGGQDKKRGSGIIDCNLHHGFVGGRLAGAKALNMQRWLWTHKADLVIFGHSHNTEIQVETVEYINSSGKVCYDKRVGAYSGTFLKTTHEGASTYSERKGYFPMPTSHVEVILQPRTTAQKDRVRVMTG